ncbi:MAG: hypothetical protein HGA76_06580, partial [Candidatus Firestonebacteria bacterium]|nr:hypothetical protein [Candidatus Firestonebacteria bacterium]
MRLKRICKSLMGGLLLAGATTLAQAAMPMDIYVTNNADTGVGTLRWAVAISNSTTGVQSIGFSLANTITVHSAISISAPTLIDGIGAQVIGSTGTSAPVILFLTSGSSGTTITGCAFINSSLAVDVQANGNIINNCRFGLDYANAAHANGTGLRVFSCSGGTIQDCIFGNNNNGVQLNSSSNVRIQGCYAGLLSSGAACGNFVGINLYNSRNCVLGGSLLDGSQRNVVSGNSGVGILVQFSSYGNNLCGNVIGLNTAMTAAVPNTYGIRLAAQAHDNYIGLPQANYGNVIAGNSVAGIYAYEANMGSQPRYNVIQNNLIGLNPSGAEFANNTGILLTNADGFLIGGSSAGGAREATVISKSTNSGIHLSGNGNTISGN